MAAEPGSETRIVKCPNCGANNRVRAVGSGAPHCGVCGKPIAWLTEAGETSFSDVARGSSIPVLIDFWAPWCGPCRAVSPAVERIAAQLAGRLKVVKVNTDEAPVLSQEFDIRGIPTLVFMQQGKESGRITGAMPEPDIRRWLEPKLPTPASSKG